MPSRKVMAIDGLNYTRRTISVGKDALQGFMVEVSNPKSGAHSIAAIIIPGGKGEHSDEYDVSIPHAMFYGAGDPLPNYQGEDWYGEAVTKEIVEETVREYHRRYGQWKAQYGFFFFLEDMVPSEHDALSYVRSNAMAALVTHPEIEKLLTDACMDIDYNPFDEHSVAALDFGLAMALDAYADATDDAELKSYLEVDCNYRPGGSSDSATQIRENDEVEAGRILDEIEEKWGSVRPCDLIVEVRDRKAELENRSAMSMS